MVTLNFLSVFKEKKYKKKKPLQYTVTYTHKNNQIIKFQSGCTAYEWVKLSHCTIGNYCDIFFSSLVGMVKPQQNCPLLFETKLYITLSWNLKLLKCIATSNNPFITKVND